MNNAAMNVQVWVCIGVHVTETIMNHSPATGIAGLTARGQGSLVGSVWEDYLEEATFGLILKALFGYREERSKVRWADG